MPKDAQKNYIVYKNYWITYESFIMALYYLGLVIITSPK